jgi:hypothetical protein
LLVTLTFLDCAEREVACARAVLRLPSPRSWEYVLTERNLKTPETLVGYSHEQGLIKRKIPMDELFLNVSQGARRGDEFTF